MSWISVAVIGGSALAGGTAGFLSAKSRNKALQGIGDPLPKFGGERPAIPGRLREVETQIDDILLRRSLGQDVGFDPSRRQALLDQFGISQEQQSKRETEDLQNFLSGAGLSRNVAARQALLGRAQEDRFREANKFRLGVDIEDLERRNQERDINTARLQQQSGLKFGQQEARGVFDLNVFNSENQQELARRGLQFDVAGAQQSPTSQALLGAAGGALGASSFGGGGIGLPSTSASPTNRFSSPLNSQALGFGQNASQQAQAEILKRRGLGLFGK